MQTLELDLHLLFYLLFAVLCFGALICLYNITRPRTRGIYGAFINDDEGEQMAVEAEIHAEEISNAFNNKRKGKQNFTKARINSDDLSGAANSEVQHIKNVLLWLIAYLFGGGKNGKFANYGDKRN
ncbi:uncharacterized protein LOC114189693 [Vigna unguiculata]|uniref:uncharacterized protein LOC114189693 n=1 Tax=Vigna unguiculata TaxID=3917 RepID=UPI0010164421|nr:uncharacterized protein LOC114189693 [Vigna unguiculata]